MDFLFIGGIGGSELLLIVFVLLLLFGGKKLPELMKGLGRGIRDFKDAVSSETEQIKEVMEDK
ncbi:MAG: twin-arginine translocase TatA/TatE family subunit [Alistipes sp.]|nr:twin-arginine translocase TatA/TatE family subunit [Alistipes sp.]